MGSVSAGRPRTRLAERLVQTAAAGDDSQPGTRSASRNMPTSTARSIRSFSQSIRSSAKARLPGSPRTLRSGRRGRSRGASGRGAARRGEPARGRRAVHGAPARRAPGSRGRTLAPTSARPRLREIDRCRRIEEREIPSGCGFASSPLKPMIQP